VDSAGDMAAKLSRPAVSFAARIRMLQGVSMQCASSEGRDMPNRELPEGLFNDMAFAKQMDHRLRAARELASVDCLAPGDYSIPEWRAVI